MEDKNLIISTIIYMNGIYDSEPCSELQRMVIESVSNYIDTFGVPPVVNTILSYTIYDVHIDVMIMGISFSMKRNYDKKVLVVNTRLESIKDDRNMLFCTKQHKKIV